MRLQRNAKSHKGLKIHFLPGQISNYIFLPDKIFARLEFFLHFLFKKLIFTCHTEQNYKI